MSVLYLLSSSPHIRLQSSVSIIQLENVLKWSWWIMFRSCSWSVIKKREMRILCVFVKIYTEPLQSHCWILKGWWIIVLCFLHMSFFTQLWCWSLNSVCVQDLHDQLHRHSVTKPLWNRKVTCCLFPSRRISPEHSRNLTLPWRHPDVFILLSFHSQRLSDRKSRD